MGGAAPADPASAIRVVNSSAVGQFESFRRDVLREVAERLSAGEPSTVEDADAAGVLLDGDPPSLEPEGDLAALRYSALSADRRAVWVVSPGGIEGARCALEALRRFAQQLAGDGAPANPASPGLARARTKLLSSLVRTRDTSAVLDALWSLLRSDLPPVERRALLAEVDELFGLGILATGEGAVDEIPSAARPLIEQRDAARLARDWGRSDELRDELAALGVEAQDSREGSVYRRRE